MTAKAYTELAKRVTSLMDAHRANKESQGADALPDEAASAPLEEEWSEATGLFMSLMFEPASDEAQAFTDELIGRIAFPARGPRLPMKKAVRIVASELMRCAANGSDTYLYRSMGANTFDALTVSYKPFCNSYKALAAQRDAGS